MIKNFFIVLIFISVGCGCAFGQDRTSKESIDRGQQVFLTNCMSCHQENGEGVEGAFPPLIKTDYVTGDTNRLIAIILQGQSGEITVNGKTYAMEMPAQSHLTDEEVADVINYIRNSWGNKTKKKVGVAEVKSMQK